MVVGPPFCTAISPVFWLATPASRLVGRHRKLRPLARQFAVASGAALLTSYSKYDVTKELPSDKGARLVFYCADSH